MIPTVFYQASWNIPKFVSIIAYVCFICIHSNLIIYHQLTDIQFLLVQLLVLGKAVMMLVDSIIEDEFPGRTKLRKQASLRRAESNKPQPKMPEMKVEPAVAAKKPEQKKPEPPKKVEERKPEPVVQSKGGKKKKGGR